MPARSHFGGDKPFKSGSSVLTESGLSTISRAILRHIRARRDFLMIDDEVWIIVHGAILSDFKPIGKQFV